MCDDESYWGGLSGRDSKDSEGLISRENGNCECCVKMAALRGLSSRAGPWCEFPNMAAAQWLCCQS